MYAANDVLMFIGPFGFEGTCSKIDRSNRGQWLHLSVGWGWRLQVHILLLRTVASVLNYHGYFGYRRS